MKSCNVKILELFYNAKHSGRIIKPEAIGRVGEDNDGLVIELTWRVVNGIIEDAKFRAFGNPNAIAITSLMTSNIIGKSVEEAVMIDENVIKEGLDEIRPEYIEAFDMVKSAIVEAYNNYLKRNRGSRDSYAEAAQVLENDDLDEITQEEQGIQSIEAAFEPSRGRGRPRKERLEPEIVGEKRGRGRPRKEIPEGEMIEPMEKRGRGRPRKIVDESEMVEPAEKRGRGRPRKIVDESQIVEPTEKRGRGRPRKERPEIEEIGEKRGRGRPRKIIPEGEMIEPMEKRGRGRPRKIVDESEVVEPAEKRGRGRPRKIVDESQIIEPAEKRGRGRPRKLAIETLEPMRPETHNHIDAPKIVIPNDLDEVINDEDVDELINGKHETETFVDDLISSKPVEEDDDFDADYDIFKSNIRNILSGKEAKKEYTHPHTAAPKEETQIKATENVVEAVQGEIEEDEMVGEKRGRGRPRKILDETEVQEQGEKRGRGRPRKPIDETEVHEQGEKRGRGRPRLNAVTLTRSLSSNSASKYNNHDIVFASKNVTTTNININVTKTTTNVEDDKSYTDDYAKNINILSVQENSNISTPAQLIAPEDEIEIEPVKVDQYEDDNKFKNLTDSELDEFDDDYEDEEVYDEDIKDEAPKGGIEDLLKALLQDD